jgi:hypothetical protein
MPILGVIASEGLAPGAPTIGTATVVDATSATVAYTAPTWAGKGTGTVTYTATSSPGSLTGTATSSPITVSGLTTGTAYTFTVKATTSYGVTGPSSAASNSITPASQNSYESIATVTVGSPTANVTFTSIPSTYTHLQIRLNTVVASWVTLQFNNDTGNNYACQSLRGDGSTANAYGTPSPDQIFGVIAASSYATGGIIDILDYTNINKNKTTRQFGGGDSNGSGLINLNSGLWMSTSVIASIKLIAYGATFSANSSFALYGIKG